jgi:NAD(P)-dependent dehydrogenase (short-subunit alcohol dehydrogenase family)
MPSLKGKTVLIIGRGTGIARAIALAVSEDGGQVIAAGRHPDSLAESYRGMDIGIGHADITDESSIAASTAGPGNAGNNDPGRTR